MVRYQLMGAFDKFQNTRSASQLRWLVCFGVAMVLAFLAIVAVINFSFSSGLFWNLSKSRLGNYEHHALQGQLFEIVPAHPHKTLIIGDRKFLDSIKQSPVALDATMIRLPGMSMLNLMKVVNALDMARYNRVVIFNAPWLWSSMAVTAITPAQDISIYSRLGKFDLKLNKLKLLLLFFNQVVKQPSKPFPANTSKRAGTFVNVRYEFQPTNRAKKVYLTKSLRQLAKAKQVIWVNDQEALPKDASPAFIKAFSDQFAVDAVHEGLGSVSSLSVIKG